jgi:hypothetical protein
MNVGEIRGTLTAVFDDRGFQRFDAAMTSSRSKARDDIRAQLGAQFNDEAFNRYEQATARAERRARDREVFKAQLGGNYNATAFNQYERAVNQSQDAHNRLTKTVDSNNRILGLSFGSLVKGIAAMGAGYAAFNWAKGAINDTIALSGAVAKLTAITGMDSKTASLWIETMKVRGVETKAVSIGFITLEKNMKAAQDGTPKAAAAFKELGVSQQLIKSGDVSKTVLAVADGLQKVENPARRAALAQQLFGRQAQTMIPILSQGRKGLEDALGAAERYGAYLPKNTKMFAEAREAQRGMNLAMDGLKIAFTTAVLPSLVSGAQRLMTFIQQMREGKGAGGDFADKVSSAFRTIRGVVQSLVGTFGGVGNSLRILGGLWIASRVVAFANAIRGVSAALLVLRANPIIFVLAGLATLAAAFMNVDGKQRAASMSARDVANAWRAAKNAALDLREADVRAAQAHLNVQRATAQVTAATRARTAAYQQFGRNSPQWRQADQDLRQAQLDLRQAQVDATRATNDQRDARNKNTDATRKAATALGVTEKVYRTLNDAQIRKIQADQQEAVHLGEQINQMKRAHAPAEAIRKKQDELRGVVWRLSREQQGLNANLRNMPKNVKGTVGIGVNFDSNVPGFVKDIAAQIGKGWLSQVQKNLGYARGGLVKQPMAIVGEEAPAHPEVIIATNPRYRQRNVDLWVTAARMLGIPGFATGGVAAREVAATEPWAGVEGASWVVPPAKAWIRKMAEGLPAIKMKAAADWISAQHYPYVWGGGHNASFSGPYDCSGAVSAVLHAANLLSAPMVSGQLGGYGEPGPGPVTIYANPTHTFMSILGKFFGTHGSSGAEWYAGSPLPGYSVRHPSMRGAFGGQVGGGDPGQMRVVTASQYAAPQHIPGWAELSTNYTAPLNRLDFAAMGHVPKGTTLAVNFGGRTIRIPKIDVGAGGPGLGGHTRAVDLSNEAAGSLPGFPGFADVLVGFAKGGILGRIPRFQGGGVWETGLGTRSWANPTPKPSGGSMPSAGIASLIGEPGLPRLGGGTPGTLAGAGTVAGNISANRSQIAQLEHDYSTLDSFYSLKEEELVNPDTGDVNETAVKRRVAQLNQLWNIRWRIHYVWGYVVARTKRLIAAYQGIIRRLTRAANAIRTKGLKGNALSSAQKHQSDLRTKITDTRGKLSDAQGELITARNDRESSWIDVLRLGGERDSVANTQPEKHDQPGEPDLGGGSGDTGGGTPEPAAPSPAEIAAAALEQLRGFQSARADLFASFGSNAVRAGANPFATATQQAAGMSYFGAASGSAPGAASGGIVINNTFQEPPADAHTWAHQQRFAVETAF